MAVTTLKPDMVIMDHKEKTIHLFELTVNWESNSEKNNTYKSEKYPQFLKDITKYKPSLTAFELGVMGHLDMESMKRLKNLHLFMRKNIKLKTFTNNLSALTVNSSNFIFTCRNESMWNHVGYLGPPFQAHT